MIDGPVFTATIKSGFVKSFDFRGRASRPDYWYWFLFIFLGQMISAFLAGDAVAGVVAVGTPSA